MSNSPFFFSSRGDGEPQATVTRGAKPSRPLSLGKSEGASHKGEKREALE
jgi:hypothetical protein